MTGDSARHYRSRRLDGQRYRQHGRCPSPSVVAQGHGAPVAILNRNEPVFYAVPAEAFEALMDKLEDIELAAMVRARLDQPEIEVTLDDL